MRAVSSAGNGAASVSVRGTPAAVPHILGNFAVEAGNGRVTLSWDNPNDATITRYRYNRMHPDQGWSGRTAISNSDIILNGSTMSYPVTGLTNGIEYAFTLSATNNVGNSPATQRFYATPTAPVTSTAPPAPTNLIAQAGDAQVTLTWTTPGNGGSTITRHQYREKIGSGEFGIGNWTNISNSAEGQTNAHSGWRL